MIEFTYQVEGYTWMAGRTTAYLADEMGLGKSIQAIRALERLTPAWHRARTLIVCPASVKPVWRRELQRWLFVPPELDSPAWTVRIVSYDEARLGIDNLKAWAPTAVIFDEAHYLKSLEAQRTRALLGKGGLAHESSVQRIWMLSGTPAPNHAGELYTMARTFGLTSLSHAGWCQAYCELDRGIGRPVGTRQSAVPELKQMLSQVMLRRHKKDVLTELPPIWHQELAVELDKDPPVQFLTEEERGRLEQMPKLRAMVKAIFDDHSPEGERTHFERLRALAPHLSTLQRYVGLQKARPVLNALKLQLSDYAGKVVVFGRHTGALRFLHQELQQPFGAVLLDGSTSRRQRDEVVKRFQDDPECRVFLGNIIAAGTGITLTAASQVVLAEYSWVPGENLQAAMRCHRIGQRECVEVQWVVGDDPLDRKVMTTLRRKAEELEQVVGGSYEDYSRIERTGAGIAGPQAGTAG